MTYNEFWKLLAKKLSGEASPEELQELEVLMKLHPDWLFAAQHVEDLWKQKQRVQPLEAEHAFASHLARMQEQGWHLMQPSQTSIETPRRIFKRKSSRATWLGMLMFVVLLTTGILLQKKPTEKTGTPTEKKFSEIVTHSGSRTNLTLPDGSLVWLNAGSKLTYGDHFGINNRNVYLSGEAFFDVKKSNMPFIIHANGLQIRVLGTAFNVKSYPGDRTTETSLIRGRIEVTVDNRPELKIVLKPNEKLVINNEPEQEKKSPAPAGQPIITLGALTHKQDNSILETSWVDNTLAFQNEAFADVAKKMERWYGVPIQIADSRIDTIHLTGTFTRETEIQALEALQITAPFHFVAQNNKIIITQ